MEIAGAGPLTSGLSRSLNVIGTDMDLSAIYDFLLVIHRNPYLVPFPR